jgi:hypothetical protein
MIGYVFNQGIFFGAIFKSCGFFNYFGNIFSVGPEFDDFLRIGDAVGFANPVFWRRCRERSIYIKPEIGDDVQVIP